MRKILVYVVMAGILVACGHSTPTGVELETAQPYRTATHTETPAPMPAMTEYQVPTSTPIVHTVVAGDTLAGIAARYGITLEALVQANPGIQAEQLSIGTIITIPLSAPDAAEPTSTPAKMTVLQARCWPETSGGLWCFALLQNGYAEPIGDISAQFTLVDESGEAVASQSAYAPLDIAPAGASMPLGVHFPGPVDLHATPRVQVLTAIRQLPGNTGYLPVMLDNIVVSIDVSGQSARVTGRLLLTTLDGRANSIRVLAVAYTAGGQLVGFRRWEAGEPLKSGEYLVFDVLASSVGPEIDHVELLAEARP